MPHGQILNGFAVLLGFQLLGELLVQVLRLPASGPICGMALLLGWLVWRDGEAHERASGASAENAASAGPKPPPDVRAAAEAILPNMAILFVPIGTGVMAHWPLLRIDWWPLALALCGSAALTLAVTAVVYQWMAARLVEGRVLGPEKGGADIRPSTDDAVAPAGATWQTQTQSDTVTARRGHAAAAAGTPRKSATVSVPALTLVADRSRGGGGHGR